MKRGFEAAAVGIDVGGTKVAAAVVDVESGRLLERRQVPTRPERGGAAVLDDCAALAGELGGGELPVGIGLCELVDLSGRPASADTVDWLGPRRGRRHRCAVASRLESDVRAAARAEARFGAGAERSPFLYVTVGTGVSGCLVVDGEPYAGARGQAIVLGAPPVEAVAGGRALERLAGLERAEDVLADAGHAALVDEAAAALGQTLAVLANALDPTLIVLGGGLGGDPGFRARVAGAFAALLAYPAEPALELVGSRLGADARRRRCRTLRSRPRGSLSSRAARNRSVAGRPGAAGGARRDARRARRGRRGRAGPGRRAGPPGRRERQRGRVLRRDGSVARVARGSRRAGGGRRARAACSHGGRSAGARETRCSPSRRRASSAISSRRSTQALPRPTSRSPRTRAPRSAAAPASELSSGSCTSVRSPTRRRSAARSRLRSRSGPSSRPTRPWPTRFALRPTRSPPPSSRRGRGSTRSASSIRRWRSRSAAAPAGRARSRPRCCSRRWRACPRRASRHGRARHPR